MKKKAIALLRTPLLNFAAVLLFFVFTDSVLAQTVTLQEGLNGYAGSADTDMWSGNPDFARGNQNAILLSNSTNMALVYFPIFVSEGGPVPNGATISSAVLSLNQFDGAAVTVQARRLKRSWNEAQATWNVAATGQAWQTAGALGAADVETSTDGQGSIGAATGWMDIDVTPGVQALAAGTPNFGWRISWISGDQSTKSFNSRNDPNNPTLRPKLTVTYNTASASACNSGDSRPYSDAPVNGNPISIAASGTTTIEAEHWNCGAEGAAYHDTQLGSVNAGQTFRADNEMEITAVTPSGLAVNQFATGEWMNYTINVPANGTYTFGILASHNSTPGRYHIEIDEADVTGSITVPGTGDWEVYQWVDAPNAVTLTAGTHTLKLFSDLQSFRVDKIRLTATPPPAACNSGSSRPYDQAPVNGNPIPISATNTTTIEAEHWNCGADGSAYHDTQPGSVNAGQTFRADNEMEIIAVTPSGLAVNQFATDEWMNYAINVAAGGNYTLGILASHNSTPGQYRIEIDNVDVTSSVTVPGTGDWEVYQWVDAPNPVTLAAGPHTLKLYSVLQSYRVDKIRIVPGGTQPPPSDDDCSRPGLDLCVRFEPAPETRFGCTPDLPCPSPDRDEIHRQVQTQSLGNTLIWSALNMGNDQPDGDRADDTRRIGLTTDVSRDGSNAMRFTTQDLDDHVHSSFPMERSMMNLADDGEDTGAFPGREQWWAHSVYFPADFTITDEPQGGNLFFQFHHQNATTGCDAPNIGLDVYNQQGSRAKPIIRAFAAGGSTCNTFQYQWLPPGGTGQRAGQCIHDDWKRGVWYDFVHHIRWSATGTGSHEIWMREGNGPVKKVLDRQNISNLYLNDSAGPHAYLSIGSYHTALDNVVTTLFQDRFRRGNSFAAVAPPGFTMPADPGVVACPGVTLN